MDKGHLQIQILQIQIQNFVPLNQNFDIKRPKCEISSVKRVTTRKRLGTTVLSISIYNHSY